MKDNEIIFAIGGLLLSVLCYFAGVSRGKFNSEQDKLEAQIDIVVKYYVTNVFPNSYEIYRYPQLLIEGGILLLKNTKDKREVLKRIIKHGKENPLKHFSEMTDNEFEKFLLSYQENMS